MAADACRRARVCNGAVRVSYVRCVCFTAPGCVDGAARVVGVGGAHGDSAALMRPMISASCMHSHKATATAPVTRRSNANSAMCVQRSADSYTECVPAMP